MELANAVGDYLKLPAAQRDEELSGRVARVQVLLLAPYAPHWAEELWHEAIGEEGSVYDQAWPAFDEGALVADVVERAVIVGGKPRAHIETPADASEEEVVAAALAAVESRLAGKTVRKTIVAGNVVNIVAN